MPKIGIHTTHYKKMVFKTQTNADKKGLFFVMKKHISANIIDVVNFKFNLDSKFETLKELEIFIDTMIKYGCDNSINKRPVILIQINLNSSTVDELGGEECLNKKFYSEFSQNHGHGFSFSWKGAIEVLIGGEIEDYLPVIFFEGNKSQSYESDEYHHLGNNMYFREENNRGGEIFGTEKYFILPFTEQNLDFVKSFEGNIKTLAENMILFFGNDSKQLIDKISNGIQLLN